MRILIATLAAILLSAPAAPQQKATPADAKKIDQCLLSKAEIEQTVGKPVSDLQLIKNNANVCQATVGGGVLNFVVVQPRPGETPDRFAQEMQKRKTTVTEVKGIGDRSFFLNQSFGMLQLSTYKGPNNVIMTMLIPGVDAAKQKDIAGKLMQKVLAKL